MYILIAIIFFAPSINDRLSIRNPFPEQGRSLPEFSYSLPSTFFVAGLSVGSLLMIVDPLTRKHVIRKIEFITSPNHTAPENKGPFHMRTLDQELNQSTQLDRGVHFMIPYLLTNYTIKATKKVAESFGLPRISAYISAVTFVGAASIIDEYLDGLQKDDGFSPFDFIANISGILYALLKQNDKLPYIDIYWDYSSKAKPDSWEWAWWNYMPAYAFHIRVDIMRMIKGEERGVFDEYTKYCAYLPFIH